MTLNKDVDLISLIIISYNQEKYIKDAILSALNQDYDNYEIIISDDCSNDFTWNKINETINNEQDKIHTVILNRNEQNLGIFGNFQKAISLSRGNWIVIMAGDDISKPNRLKVINELSQAHENIYAIGTGYDTIDAKGNYLYKNISCIRNEINLPMYPGFSAAINRDTFLKFPKIKENIQSEDIIYSLRAFELGNILLSDISTVKYRIHSQNITSKGTSIEDYKGKIKNHFNAIKTLEYYKTNELRNKKLIPVIENQIKTFEENVNYYNYIIRYYNLNFFNKIFNIFKPSPYNQNKKQNTIFVKFKIFCESYIILSFVVNRIKDFSHFFKTFNGIVLGNGKENTNFKICKI